MMDELEAFDPELVIRLEKQKEKERRERVRETRKLDLKIKNEERLKASLLRSQAPVMRKTGKQIMFRSAKQQEKKLELDTSVEQGMLEDHRVFGVHFGKDGLPHTEQPEIPVMK